MWPKLKEYRKYLPPLLLGVFVFSLITNFQGAVGLLSAVFGWFWFVFSRILWGLGAAYVLNFFVRWLRKRLRFPNWLAILSSYLVLIGLTAWLLIYIVPYMAHSVEQIVTAAPDFERRVQEFVRHTFPQFDAQTLETIDGVIQSSAGNLREWSSGLFNVEDIFETLKDTGRGFVGFCFGFLVSFYALAEKDKAILTIKRLMSAYMKPEKVEGRIRFCREAHEIFSGYIVGKVIDSLIVGVISLVLYAVFGLEMTPLLAFLAFLFNMIPYFGPIIGMVISAIILLFFSPLHALYCLIISIALQALDGSFIAPKILGSSVGLSPLLTIIAISVGGDVGGLFGVFLSIPILATFKMLVVDRQVKLRLERRLAVKTAGTAGKPPDGGPPGDGGGPTDLPAPGEEAAERGA
jgi:predicted PurR-regulated permease PerM